MILVNQKIDAKKKGKNIRIEKKYIYNSKHNLFDFNKRKCRGNIIDPRKTVSPLCRELAQVEIDDTDITLEQFITDVFMYCVYILQVIGGAPGEFEFGYYLANLMIFVILQPGLILLFFILWRLEKKKNL